MSFLAPYMLGGLFACGIPIALHFFYRSRYRTVPWAAMKFLLASIEQTSRRLRFQELLLLILRVTVLALLALALARPSTTAARGGQGDVVDAVLLLDTSLSMAARDGVAPPNPGNDPYLSALKQFAAADGSVTRLDRAKAAALAVLAGLPPHSTAQVITVSDRATLLGPQTPSHLDQARQIISDIEVSHLGSDLLPGISEAITTLRRGQSPNKELYLFSDMQKRGWDAQAASLADKLKDLHGFARVHLIHCATRTPDNAAIIGITPQSSLRTGERADFAVLVHNTGAGTLRNLSVSLEVDGKTAERDTRPLDELKPGETRAVLLTGLLDRPGRRILTARIKNDDLDADNRFDQVIVVHDEVGILLVDGTPNEREPRSAGSFFLQHALNLPAKVTPAERATPRLLANKELCILVNARLEPSGKNEGGNLSPEFLKNLSAFVRDGHALMIFAGDHVEPESYNRLLHEQYRLLPSRISRVAEAPPDKPWTLERQSAELHPFAKFREDASYAGIDRVEVRRILELEQPTETSGSLDETRVLLRYNNGAAAIATRKRPGEGEVMLFTTSASDPRWTDWFITLSFVPFVQVSLNYLLQGQPQAHNRIAGEPLHWQAPRAGTARAYDLVRPDGEHVRLGYPETVAGRPLVIAEDTARAGVYRIQAADRTLQPGADGDADARTVSEAEGVPFAVAPDVRDSEQLQPASVEDIDNQLGFKAVHLTASDEGGLFGSAERMKDEWTMWLLATLFVLVLGETVLAWFCGRAW
ncbi:MAG TPA: BatA domain-containing protein [Gemmataceae bacterium]|nr:BatA domain-containing protein [Gemmataceae bacterium]